MAVEGLPHNLVTTMNPHKIGLLAAMMMLASLAALPNASALTAVKENVCYRTGSLGDGTGWDNHAERTCVTDDTQTGGTGVLCYTEEDARGGGYGADTPAAYRGRQTCVASKEGWVVCVGYAWYYANNGGDVQGDKDGYQCNGPLA